MIDGNGERTMMSYEIMGWGQAPETPTGVPLATINFPAGVCVSTYWLRHCVIWDVEMMKAICGHIPPGGGNGLHARTPFLLH
jgi:hypothetical protein